jgi:hypothetical protein
MDTGTSLTRGSATVFQAPSGAVPVDTVQMVVRILPEKEMVRPRQRVNHLLFGPFSFALRVEMNNPPNENS